MTTTATAALGRARAGVTVGLVSLVMACWAYLWLLASRMGDMSSVLSMPMTSAWTASQAALMALMWSVMMAAMMLPAAVPMVLAYERMERGSTGPGSGSTGLFVGGYLLVWAGFAIVATSLQWTLHDLALVDGMGAANTGSVAGAVLVVAGVMQFSPVKKRFLMTCRTPLGFLMTSWREGKPGALAMGVHHGILCVGCCWALMALLFVLGVMNLAWVVALAVLVLLEKVAPRGEILSRVSGSILAVWGIYAVAFL